MPIIVDQASTDLLVATTGQLAGDHAHLRCLQTSLQRTMRVIQRGTAAYVESCKLLERIDGAPTARVESEIHFPE